jgi:hypothetical protein
MTGRALRSWLRKTSPVSLKTHNDSGETQWVTRSLTAQMSLDCTIAHHRDRLRQFRPVTHGRCGFGESVVR